MCVYIYMHHMCICVCIIPKRVGLGGVGISVVGKAARTTEELCGSHWAGRGGAGRVP